MGDDSNTTISELREFTSQFCEKRNWGQFHTPKDMAMNAIIELGELLDHFRFHTEDEIKEILANPAKKKEISAEFSDAFYSILRLADLLELDMSTELKKKMRETASKYPISKSKNSNKKYTEL